MPAVVWYIFPLPPFQLNGGWGGGKAAGLNVKSELYCTHYRKQGTQWPVGLPLLRLPPLYTGTRDSTQYICMPSNYVVIYSILQTDNSSFKL